MFMLIVVVIIIVLSSSSCCMRSGPGVVGYELLEDGDSRAMIQIVKNIGIQLNEVGRKKKWGRRERRY